MSRIGKKIIELPDKVKVEVKDNVVCVQGPKAPLGLGLTRLLPSGIEVEVTLKGVEVKRKDDKRQTRALHGMTRTLISNMVTGVSTGFEKRLEINGLGLKAKVQGQTLSLNLGFTQPVDLELPKEITAKVEGNTKIILFSADKELLGRVTAEIKGLKGPEPYKGTGIKYEGEVIIRKVGKTTGAAAG